MSTLIIPVSQDYLLHVDAQPTPHGTHVAIRTQWLGAKDPAGIQTRYSITLPPDVVTDIANHLLSAQQPEVTHLPSVDSEGGLA